MAGRLAKDAVGHFLEAEPYSVLRTRQDKNKTMDRNKEDVRELAADLQNAANSLEQKEQSIRHPVRAKPRLRGKMQPGVMINANSQEFEDEARKGYRKTTLREN